MEATEVSRVGERMRDLRQMRKLSQVELADRLHVSQPIVSDYERGRVRIDADMVPSIAKALGVPLAALYGDMPQEDIKRADLFKLFEAFLTWQSGRIPAEGSHSLVPIPPIPVPTPFTEAFPNRLDPSPSEGALAMA